MDRIDILPSAPVLPRDGRAKPIEEKTESKFRRLQKRLDEKNGVLLSILQESMVLQHHQLF